LVQPPTDLDVRLVETDHEALVEVTLGLIVDRVHDRLGAVPEVLARDPSGEVEIRPAVRVPDRRAFRPVYHHVVPRESAGDVPPTPRPDGLRVRALLDRHRCQLRTYIRVPVKNLSLNR